MSTSRLYAIQTLAQLTVAGIPEDECDPAAEAFAECMVALGVDVDEIRDAMNFALIVGE